MDRVLPGTSAADCTMDEVADLLRPLVTASASTDELPSISAWIRQRLTGDLSSDMYPGANEPSQAERLQALELLDVLEGDEAWSVCHSDLSLGNLIRSQSRLYLIDPRGMTSDVEYDAAVASIKAQLDLHDLTQRLEVDAARD